MTITEDTICAIASAPSGAARGIIRISGRQTLSILRQALLNSPAWPQRMAQRLPIALPIAGFSQPLTGAALVWPTGRSYTGQPSAELHLPGCMPLLDGAIEELVAAGARPARPGEFTLRAFLAGRLDLTQAEAVLGVIDADDQRSLAIALEQLAGGLSGPLGQIRGQLLDLLSHLEAGLDFVEEDIEFITASELSSALADISQRLTTIREQLSTRASSSDLPLVVLRGKPNAGKSRLMNALAGNQAAIVAELAGTTRDTVHTLATVGRHTIRLADTAGVEAGRNAIEQQAQAAGEAIHQRATLRLICWDALDPTPPPVFATDQVPSLWVRTKVDLQPTATATAANDPASDIAVLPPTWIPTSSLTGVGLDNLKQYIAQTLDSLSDATAGGVANTAVRCAASLDRAIESIAQASQVSAADGGQELVASEMRIALSALGEVTGEVYTDDILDRIFSRFCIGK